MLVAYAVTYLFGTLGTAIYCANVAPRLLGIADLKAAARAKEIELGMHGTTAAVGLPDDAGLPAVSEPADYGADDDLAGNQQVEVSDQTRVANDFVIIGIGVAVGVLVGVVTFDIGSFPLTLTPSVGALLLGLLIGWRRGTPEEPGQQAPGVQWFFETAGLTVFVAMIGINAGPGFVDGMRDFGVELLLAGIAVTLISLVAGTLVARYIFRFDPVLTLGLLVGAMATSAAVGSVREAADSNVPVLSYGVPFAVANIVRSIGGAVVVAVLA